MNNSAIRYAVLRDRRAWDDGVTSIALQKEAAGELTLARIPGAVDGRRILAGAPADPEPSGLAVGSHKDLYIADAKHNRVVQIGGTCNTTIELRLDGAWEDLKQPGALLVLHDNLYIADSVSGRVMMFRLPTLELRGSWHSSLEKLTGLAADSKNRIYVLGEKQVLRFSAFGEPDNDYNASFGNHFEASYSLAIDGTDTLYVSGRRSNSVLRFDTSGSSLGAIRLSPRGNPMQPRSLVARRDRLYIADAMSGLIWAFDARTETYLGTLGAYRGPVTALVLDEKGTLFVKPGLDETVYELQPDLASVVSGEVKAGPLDAGELSEWERLHVEAEMPTGTDITLYTYVNDVETGPLTDSDWNREPTLDILLERQAGTDNPHSRRRRYLWLRIVLTSENQVASPRLVQVEAQTTAESYLDYLPAVYRREDAPTRFLESWLALFRSQLSDWESLLDEMPQRFDPQTTPEDHLSWLAQWLAFQLPPHQDAEASRASLQRAHSLYQRRGTPYGLREFVELYTGVAPQIFEAFHERRLWQLGHTSQLGFDTALAGDSPDGLILPGTTFLDPEFMGLKGDYYNGVNFDRLLVSRTDRKVEFAWEVDSPHKLIEADDFSVRWTGQVKPRYSETYTFHTFSDDGVRLWVDGRLLIDNWTDHGITENTGRIALTADRWYPIVLEFYEKGGGATIKLLWSSRSQSHEIIPTDHLYALVDETATLPSNSPKATGETLLVGQTVVGEAGPVAQSEFGAPLASDTAHLFTVLVLAARMASPAKRQLLKQVVEQEKPAHTDFHLCFVDGRMRVGFQARIGVDSIVAGPPPPMALTGAVLGWDSYLGSEAEGEVGRVGKHSRIGQNTVIA